MEVPELTGFLLSMAGIFAVALVGVIVRQAFIATEAAKKAKTPGSPEIDPAKRDS
jgi:hypothetical protein